MGGSGASLLPPTLSQHRSCTTRRWGGVGRRESEAQLSPSNTSAISCSFSLLMYLVGLQRGMMLKEEQEIISLQFIILESCKWSIFLNEPISLLPHKQVSLQLPSRMVSWMNVRLANVNRSFFTAIPKFYICWVRKCRRKERAELSFLLAFLTPTKVEFHVTAEPTSRYSRRWNY